jgi:hypothetical protein
MTTPRNALLSLLAAGLLALAATAATVDARQTRFNASLTRAGFGFMGSVDGWLDEDEAETREFWLQRGVQYAFAGTCDGDCTDIDLKLFNRSGALLAEDTDADDIPQVVFTPPANGTYRLRVLMYRCRIEPCRYDIDQYRR